jgi:hypothetical protein
MVDRMDDIEVDPSFLQLPCFQHGRHAGLAASPQNGEG